MEDREPRSLAPAVVSAGLCALLVGTTALGSYGWFIDEFYYLACARFLAFGYVDHPPLSIGLLAVTRAIVGDSMVAVRAPAALAAAGASLTAALLARRLGGGPFAQTLAALATALAPGTLIVGSFFSMNPIELFLWALANPAGRPRTLRRPPAALGRSRRHVGVGLEDKHTAVLPGVALAIGLLLTPACRHLRTPWPWLGVLRA